MQRNNLYAAYAALIIANLIWGAAGPVIKLTLNFVPIFTFLFLRFLIVGIVLLPYLLIELKKVSIHKQDIFNIILLGIFGQSSLFFVFAGLKYTTALDSAIISVITPILSVAAGHYFFNEKVNNWVKFGVVVATLGTLVVVIEPILQDHLFLHPYIETRMRIFGNLLTLLYNFAFLLYIIWSKISLGQTTSTVKKALDFIHIKPMKKHYSPILLTVLTFYVALATFIPLAILEHFGYFGANQFSLNSLTVAPFLGIVYMAILSSIVAYIAFEWGLLKVSLADTAILSYMGPIFTLPFSYWMLGEVASKTVIIGSIIIAIGVAVAEKKKA